MKKVLLGLAVIAMMASFTSCKKTCTCTVTTQNKVLDPSWFDNDAAEIAEFETPQVATATGQYKGKCSDQNSTVTQSNAVYSQTVTAECK